MVKIRKNIVPSNIAKKVTYGGTNTKTYIIIHETDNTNKGANADAHSRLQANGNSRLASWQYTVDDKEIVQSFSDSAQCWAAGNAHYNKHGINVEICVNSDGNFKKAVDLTAELVKQLMKKYNIALKHVIRHHDASGKNCPRLLMKGEEGITWNEFKAKLSGNKSSNTNISTSKPKPPKPSKNKPNLKTDSIVVYLDSVGENSTYAHRKKLAAQHNIKNYTGTAAQNTKLLKLLRDGSKTSSKTKANLKVDGYEGPETIKAEQRYHGTPVDGVISRPSTVIRARQKLLGVKQDGYVGPITIRAEQKRYGTPQDGKISRPSTMIKERQRRLNKGKL